VDVGRNIEDFTKFVQRMMYYKLAKIRTAPQHG